MIAAIFFAWTAQPAAMTIPVSASVETVASDPSRFDGRRLQVHGWLSCDLAGCNLSSPSGAYWLPIENGSSASLILKDWAPAHIIVEGRFEEQRLRPPVRSAGNVNIIIVERSRSLRDVRLLRVIREGRPQATQGE